MAEPNEMNSTDWPEPLPLVPEAAPPAPYPCDALPTLIRDAVCEVQGFVQCPIALAAMSALNPLSVAAQGLYNVERAPGLVGPISLFTLAIAESGERKTSCDAHFAKPLTEWECERRRDMADEVSKAKSLRDVWEAQREALLCRIKQAVTRKAAAGNADPAELREQLVQHDRSEPQAILVPRLVYSDTTPEALTLSLAKVWPSGCISSSEAGLVLGAHAMSKEVQLRGLALLNVLWDGGRAPIDRKTSESFVAQEVRLSISLACQDAAYLEFMRNTRGLARGLGFFARFLLAKPTTTMGKRLFKASPIGWPRLAAYHVRVREILETPVTHREGGGLVFETLRLTETAQGAWIEFHNEVERELAPGGDMEATRDVAAKTADNAARLAGLFTVLEGNTEIGIEAMRAGADIAAWHLYEAKRILASGLASQAAEDAESLEQFLADWLNPQVSRRDIQRLGPCRTRKAERLDAALALMVDRGRARVDDEGRVALNPLLRYG